MTKLVIDGNNLACISYYSLTRDAVLTKENALSDFTQRIKSYGIIFNTTEIFLCWDVKNGKDWRKSLYPDYKSKRDSDPLRYECINYCRDNNKFMNLSVDSAEGDDVIYATCKFLTKENSKDDVIIISSDHDMIQIVQEGFAKNIYDPYKKAEAGTSFVKIPDYDICIYKSVVGDSSDGIHGVPRRGEKFAEKYLRGDANLTDTEEETRLLCEQIVRLSLNPKCRDFYNAVADMLR